MQKKIDKEKAIQKYLKRKVF